MRRRAFIAALGSVAVWPSVAHAAAGQDRPHWIYRAASPNEKEFNAFRSGLRALGYVEGQNIAIEHATRPVIMIVWASLPPN